MDLSRREFIHTAAVAALSMSKLSIAAPARNGIPYRVLGKTGEQVSLLAIGGSNIALEEHLTENQAIKLMRTAIDEGINFFDNAWCYHEGRAEERMGKALRDGYRKKIVLMTKHHGRDPKMAEKHLEDSLKRLQTDVIDVWQFHEIDELGEIIDIYDSGVLDFALKAKQQGKIRHIGFTGHYRPYVHLEMIKRGFDWDTIQMPINVLDYHYYSFTKEVLPIAVEKNLGVIGMKSLCGTPSPIVANNIAKPEDAMRFSMTMPISTLCSGIDSMEILHKNLEIARNFKPMTKEDIEKLMKQTADFAKNGTHEGYKSYEIDELPDNNALPEHLRRPEEEDEEELEEED